MPIVKKAPGIMTREVQLEEPVNELLEDYARFIESNADHVINVVLKKDALAGPGLPEVAEPADAARSASLRQAHPRSARKRRA